MFKDLPLHELLHSMSKKNVCCIFNVFCVMGMCHTEGKCWYVAFLDNKAIQRIASEKNVNKLNEQ